MYFRWFVRGTGGVSSREAEGFWLTWLEFLPGLVCLYGAGFLMTCYLGHKAFGRDAGWASNYRVCTCGGVLVARVMGFWMAGFALSGVG